MLWRPLLACTIVAIILGASEIMWRNKMIKGEYARKFIHILAGGFAAFMPFWLSYNWIALFGLGVICLGLINHNYHFIKAGLSIERRSYGDILFAMGILIAALMRPNKWIFTAATLQVALADGMAAIIGHRYGKHRYTLFGHTKTPIGTLTFFVFSQATIGVLFALSGLSADYSRISLYVLLPLTLTALENISGYGTDNLTLPVGFLLLLQLMKL